MGQKIHPTGFRMAVNKNWKSVWYSDKANYASMLRNDLKVRKYIEKKHGDISCWQNWDSEREYNKAQKDLQDIVRSIKIKNRIAQIITILIFLICPFVGLRFIGWIGVIIGFILGFISLYFTPKALGITR